MASDALTYITIKGFKSIASIEKLELRPINVLIGPNGSGKSNFVGVFSFLHAIREGRLRTYVATAGGAEKILHFGSKTTTEVVVRLSFLNQTNGYELHLVPTVDDNLFPDKESAYYWDKKKYPSPMTVALQPDGVEAGISLDRLDWTPGWVRSRLGSWRVYHMHDTSPSSPMRKTARIDDNRFLRPDGSNLAAFLFYLQQMHHRSYDLIRKTVERVAPFFADFHLEPLSLKPDDIKLQWKHKNFDGYFDVSSLSDGTLRFIALTTLFLQPSQHRPSAILVDEPELGLHPYAIGLLASMIKQAAVDTQVIVSTQSSLLLDYFEPDDVLVADCVEGATRLTRLEREKLAEWLKDYSLGQLWEKNDIGGLPGSL